MIVFTNGKEVIATTIQKEHECVKQYFTEGGRNLDEYDKYALTPESSEPAILITQNAEVQYGTDINFMYEKD